jgi:hypothetical protein
MTTVSAKALERALSAADFPATKEDLLAAAREQEADEAVEKALRSLPPVEYGNVDEVIRSVTVDVE